MIPWVKLDSTTVPGAGELALFRRDKEFVIRIGGADLMGSRVHGSEEDLCKLGCAHVADAPGARVLIGGLGLGFSLRAALDELRPDARVDVAEISPSVVRWNKEFFPHLAKHPLDDRRSHVLEGDVNAIIGKARGTYDAIMLDVDNGPDAFTVPTNSSIYSNAGVERIRGALRAGGVFSLWSVGDDAQFTARLRKHGFDVRVVRAAARPGTTHRHYIWVAKKLEVRPPNAAPPSEPRRPNADPKRAPHPRDRKKKAKAGPKPGTKSKRRP